MTHKQNGLAPKELDSRIDWMIRVYLFSTNDDAGWLGSSTLGALIDYKGDIPRGEGPADNDAKMINQIGLLDTVASYTEYTAFILNQLTDTQKTAVLCEGQYKNQPSEKPGVTWMTNEEIAARAEMTLDQYESAKKRGRAAFKKQYLHIREILLIEKRKKKSFQNR